MTGIIDRIQKWIAKNPLGALVVGVAALFIIRKFQDTNQKLK